METVVGKKSYKTEREKLNNNLKTKCSKCQNFICKKHQKELQFICEDCIEQTNIVIDSFITIQVHKKRKKQDLKE